MPAIANRPRRERQPAGGDRRRRLPPGGAPMNTFALAQPRIDRVRRSPGLLLALICVAQFMVILDVAVVNVALPSIRSSLGFSTAGLQWVVNAYTLTFAGFLMLGGRASDLLGRRRVLLAGIALFTLSSLACALSDSASLLIAARAVQGIGGAIDLAGQPRDPDHVVRRGPRAQPRARHLGGDRRHRRRLGRAARRDAHAGPRLAVGVPGQRAGRRGRARARAADRAGGPRRARTPPLRPQRRAARDRRLRRARLRDRPRRGARLGRAGRARADHRRRRAARRVRRRRGLGREGAARAARDLRAAAAARRQPRRAGALLGRLRDVVLPLALRAGGARLQRDPDRPRVPADDARRRGRLLAGAAPRGADRRALDDHRRHADRRAGPGAADRRPPGRRLPDRAARRARSPRPGSGSRSCPRRSSPCRASRRAPRASPRGC